MARGRMVNQTIAEDAEFNSLSLEAQLVYLRTIPHLDRDGLINGHPSVLWGKVAPLMPDLLGAMPTIIEEMVTAGLVIKYVVGKNQILFFKGFTKNQVGMRYEREPASTFPIPPGYKRTNEGLTLDDKPGNDQTPPRIEEPPKPSMPPSNGVLPHEEKQDNLPVQQTSGKLPANFRQTSGNLPPEENRIEINKTTTTRAHEAEPTPEEKSGGGGSLPKHRNRQTDTDYARLCGKFESEGFGTLTAIMGEEISALLNEYPVDWIDDAMTVSVEANKRQIRYVRGILVRWRSQGRNDKQPNGQSPPQVMTLKQWCMKNYNVDNPRFVQVVPEATLYEQYNQYRSQCRSQYQQAH